MDPQGVDGQAHLRMSRGRDVGLGRRFYRSPGGGSPIVGESGFSCAKVLRCQDAGRVDFPSVRGIFQLMSRLRSMSVSGGHRMRMCLHCGYRGRELQGDRSQLVFQCPSCRGDLYARPARTYAEMEGLSETCSAIRCVDHSFGSEQEMKRSVTDRWAGRLEWVAILLLTISLILATAGSIVAVIA